MEFPPGLQERSQLAMILWLLGPGTILTLDQVLAIDSSESCQSGAYAQEVFHIRFPEQI